MSDRALLLRHRRRPATPATPADPDVRWRRFARGLTGLLVALAAWWVVTDLVAAPGSLLSRFTPTTTGPAIVELFVRGDGWFDVVVTLERLLIGLGIAVLVGVPIGVAVGRSSRLAQYTGSLFQFLRMISPLAWTPIAIVLLGVGDQPVYFLVAVAAVWPVLLGAAAGVHALDPGWLQVSRSLGATPREQLRTIVLPGIRAHLATGIRVALGTAWIVIVPAEMLGVDSGLGYAILDARDRLRYDELMGVILVIGALGYALDSTAQRLTRRRRRTRPTASGGGLPPDDAPGTQPWALWGARDAEVDAQQLASTTPTEEAP